MVARLIEGMTFAERVLLGVGLFVGSSLVSLVAVTAVLVSLPPGHFRSDTPAGVWPRGPVLRALWRIGKNLLGLALVALGALLSLPGIPGQGLLTILIGLILLDFPGKRGLERRLVSRPSVLGAINRLRARFGRPPMEL
ncbi:MAG TPA: hypothetical protein VJU81_07025 [Methylomirabilota bacterium]|nr:hypothetical protein [Methylomirabilota bacterium]